MPKGEDNMSLRNSFIELDKFQEQIYDWDSKLSDEKAYLTETEYIAPKKIVLNGETVFGKWQEQGFLNDNAFQQLCNRINAPATWLQTGKCPVDLEQVIINRMKETYNGNCLFRMREYHDKQIVRAVLSDQYAIYNHRHLWDSVMEAVGNTGLKDLHPQIWKPYVDDYMNAWIIFQDAVYNQDKYDGTTKLYDGGQAGEGLKPAIHIRNSEDGTGSVRIDSGFYRSYCTNGVLIGFNTESALKVIHKFSNEKIIDIKVRTTIIEAARNSVIGIEKFIEAVGVKLNTEVTDSIIDSWSKKFSMPSGITTGLKEHGKYAHTWADMVMIVSDYAGTQVDSKVSVDLESMAGDMLMSTPKPHYLERR